MGQKVMRKECFAVLKVKVTERAQSDTTVSTISVELLIFLQPNLIGGSVIESCSILCKDWLVVFKIPMKVENFIGSLSVFSFAVTTDLLAT